MFKKIRIATFNLENFDDKPGRGPSLEDRIALMRPQLIRVNADILCLQEVHGQEEEGHPRRLLALEKLIEGTVYAHFNQASTKTSGGEEVYDKRNLVILSRYEIVRSQQHRHDLAMPPSYRKVTAVPAEDAKEIRWERPILHATIRLGDDLLEVLNLHLKSRIPSPVEGQNRSLWKWNTASGWAEGFFISSMKRVGQALETRILVDQIFDQKEDALMVVCGDFNADSDAIPLQAIRGDVENTGNSTLSGRVLIPCERSIPEPSRFSFLYHGQKKMIDHLLISRRLLKCYTGSEIHNELLHDESVRFRSDKQFPESDHAPVIATFELPIN